MSVAVSEAELPLELGAFAAVEAAYPLELSRVTEALSQRLPVLVEADKELTPYFYKCLRDRLKREGKQFVYLDGRPSAELPPIPAGTGLLGSVIFLLREVVRGAVGERIVVLPHLDLLTSSSGALTSEAREVVTLLYENPETVWLGFTDPSLPLPKVIERLFPHRESILGVGRDRLRHLVTQRESRKFGRTFNPYQLYKHVSGVNAVRLRRLLGAVKGEDYPTDAGPAIRQLRSSTLTGLMSVPELDLHRDIGGYPKVKARIQREILDVLAHKDRLASEDEMKRVEALIPRGMIFWGPPGTGKTLFAKAMASALGAAVTVVSGPELKSKWVGESEENLRQVFVRARRSAPALIIFDELDSFASARGSYQGSGVEHSMVNQLLTEMDGFRKEELVFVVGTTNFVESLDGALLRPGRFEFHLHVPFPSSEDRRAIFDIYDRRLGLALSERALAYAVKRTGELVDGQNTFYTGDHIQALCRSLARMRLREQRTDPTEVADVEQALVEYQDRPELTPDEERVVATHEAGHAVAAMFCPHVPAVERISIRADTAGVLGAVHYSDPARRFVVTRGQLLDHICTLFGGREAEQLFLEDLSIGSADDLARATGIARGLVEEFGMVEDVGVRQYLTDGPDEPQAQYSERTRRQLDAAVRDVLDRERLRARRILEQHKTTVLSLRDLLLEKKVLDRQAFGHLFPSNRST